VYTKPTNQNLSTRFLRFSRDDQIWYRGQKWPFFTHFWTLRFQHSKEVQGSSVQESEGEAQALHQLKHIGSTNLVHPTCGLKDKKNRLFQKIGKNGVQKTRLFSRDLREGGDIPKTTRHRNGFGSRVVRYQYGIEPLSLQKAIGVFVKFRKKHFFFSKFWSWRTRSPSQEEFRKGSREGKRTP
jgi:hypothetical protein